MAQTVANLAAVIKDIWTSDRILKQFYDENPLLEMLRQVTGKVDEMGLQAQVPIHSQRGTGGYTSVAAAGGNLNAASQQTVAQATFTMVYHWMQIGLETAVLNQTQGAGARAIVDAKNLEMQGAISDVTKQISRQMARNGDSILAECATGGAATEVELRPVSDGANGHGFDAIVRGHLHPGMVVDIGTTADTDALVTGSTITAVEESETTPSITIGSSISTTAGTHFVYVANPNSATAANPELNGLENLVGTATLGGINPATAGNEYWKSYVDTSTTSFSLPFALNLQRRVFQKGGKYQTKVITGARQMQNFYLELQNQVRFAGEQKLGAGGVGGLVGLDWNGVGVNVFPDVYDTDWFHITPEDLCMIFGAWKKPMWATDIEGSGGSLLWGSGTTAFGNGVVWAFQLGTQRRNRAAAGKALAT